MLIVSITSSFATHNFYPARSLLGKKDADATDGSFFAGLSSRLADPRRALKRSLVVRS
jgi:hypothetical protein